MLKLCPAILDGGRGQQTQFWNFRKGTTQRLCLQRLVQIGRVVSEEKIKMSKVNGRTDDGRLVIAKARMTLRVR